MMYLFDFFGFLFHELSQLFNFAVVIFGAVGDVLSHMMSFVEALPLWLSVPFSSLLMIAVVFRVTQFIPTIGGAS